MTTLSLMARRTFDPASTTLIEAATRKVGVRAAGSVVLFVMEWRDARDRAGRDITIAEFIELSGMAERTAFHRLKTFRRVFDARPGLTPNDVLRVHDAAEFAALAATA